LADSAEEFCEICDSSPDWAATAVANGAKKLVNKIVSVFNAFDIAAIPLWIYERGRASQRPSRWSLGVTTPLDVVWIAATYIAPRADVASLSLNETTRPRCSARAEASVRRERPQAASACSVPAASTKLRAPVDLVPSYPAV
jgi:hypothetical protein